MLNKNIILNQSKLTNINAILLILFAFVLPLSVAISNIIAGLIVLVWLMRGTFKQDFQELKSNKVILAILVFYFLHILGLLWTEDLKWGIHILKKESKLLLLPIFMLFARKEFIKYYIYAFLSSMLISVALSYGIWLGLLEPFKYATNSNPTPLMSHISYNPFLAIAIYLLCNIVLFASDTSRNQKLLYIFLIIVMSINMFITGGRAGQVIYFLMLVILIFQYFNTAKTKAFLISIIIVPMLFISFYYTSSLFQERVNFALQNIENLQSTPDSSLGLRINIAINSIDIFKEHPMIGVGTGDFKVEFKKINKTNSDIIANTDNPHNMYVLEIIQFGILGLLSILLIFFYQIKFSITIVDKYIRNIGIVLPISFAVLLLSDSYLLGHYTTMLFVLFSSFLYKQYDNLNYKL